MPSPLGQRPPPGRAAAGSRAPGFVDGEVVEEALGRALCLLLPSRREGYGLIVLEALSCGTPVVVAPGAPAYALAAAMVQTRTGSRALRQATLAWFRGNATQLLFETPLTAVVGMYNRD